MTNILLMGMPGGSEWTFIITIFIICIFYLTFRKGSKYKKNEDSRNYQKNSLVNEVKEVKIDIPETCPHCKNPNTKKIRLCEWCGSQII